MWMIQKNNKNGTASEKQLIGAASKPQRVQRVGEIVLSSGDKHKLCMCSETFSTGNPQIMLNWNMHKHRLYKWISKSIRMWQISFVWNRSSIISYIWSKDHKCANMKKAELTHGFSAAVMTAVVMSAAGHTWQNGLLARSWGLMFCFICDYISRYGINQDMINKNKINE